MVVVNVFLTLEDNFRHDSDYRWYSDSIRASWLSAVQADSANGMALSILEADPRCAPGNTANR